MFSLDKSQSLESKLEKPDWKQWIPIFGLYEVSKANIKGAPAINENMIDHPIIYFGGMIYHAMITAGTISMIYGLFKIGEEYLR